MGCERLQNWNVYWNKKTNSFGCTWMVATQVTYISCRLDLISNFRKRGWGVSYIGDMIILRSLSKWSITTNYKMIQPSNISCGGTHQIWSQKISKDKDRMVHILETKWPSTMKTWCVWGVICWYNLYCVIWPQFIFCIWNS